jgi:MYXO-CTERM domain-containing protein
MKPNLAHRYMLGAAICFWASGAFGAAPAGDAEAKKTIKSAMENYMAGDNDVAVKKLNQATALCRTQTCTPSVQGEIYSSLAVVHWVGLEDTNAALDDLRGLLKADPKATLDDSDAPPELVQAFEKLKKGAPAAADAGAARPAPVAPAPPAAAPPAAAPPAVPPKKADAGVEDKKAEEARKAEEAQKATLAKEEAGRKAADDAKRTAAEQKEAARKAAENKKKEAEEKKEAARKEAADKKEAARKEAEEKKEAARKAAEDKKEAARKAAEDKKAEIARKAEEAAKKAEEERLAKEDQKMRTPPPVGKLQESPWHEQTKGYPIPIFVKLPPTPRGIEKPRVEVVKVVTEYVAGDASSPKQVELKPLSGGGYGGLIPCDASMVEGDVTYFTTALNKYDNPVAGGGTRAKPNKVHVKPVFIGTFPHLPGELPPRVCKEDRGGHDSSTKDLNAKAAPGPACTTSAECPNGGLCTKDGCTSAASATPASAAPPLATPAPRSGGCAGCRVGSSGDASWMGGAAFGLALGAAGFARRRRRSRVVNPA